MIMVIATGSTGNAYIIQAGEEILKNVDNILIKCKGFKFADKDIFALSKIILESRAFSDQEMDRILNLLIHP